MNRTRLVLIIALILIILLLAARETGSINLNLYTNSLNTNQSSVYSTAGKTPDQPISFDITLTHDDQPWMEHRKAILGQPRVPITGDLTTTFAGNTWLPLRKSFTMTYTCNFATPPGTTPSLDGEITGEVSATITGLCSRQEARRIALEAAKKQIREYILKIDP